MAEDSYFPALKWELRTETDQSLDRYRDFWGDEYGWTALLPLAWSSYFSPGFSIKPVLSDVEEEADIYSAASYWSAAIHLLGLGMGWTDIGEGLRKWRQNDYPHEHHPILDFIKRNYGEDIRALEVWFGVDKRYLLKETLTELSRKSMEPIGEPEDISRYEQWDREYNAMPHSERNLAAMLLGGGDALHLEHHVVDSIRGENYRGAEPWINRRNGDKADNVTFYKYGGWAFQLAEMLELRPKESDVHVMDQAIKVEIEKIGYLGEFVLHPDSNRWFVLSTTYGVPSLQWEAHKWGNPS